MAKTAGPTPKKTIETITHDDAKRKNIPTAEFESVMRKDEKTPIRAAYERRNKDLDPQLVWRGKDVQDWSDLVVHAPPLYIQEKVHPKFLIDDLKRLTEKQNKANGKVESETIDLFADFNGLPSQEAKTEFYQHDSNWSNRMILGDSLQVMASLAEREGLRGQVQTIYFDPPYGIKFNSNFQWSTTSRDVKDGNVDHITREPEQVKAFRDTWRDGIHSYLTYLRDRLTVARELLTESGSIFVQIGDENVHRVRAVMDEVFGEDNFIGLISFFKTSSQATVGVQSIVDYLILYAKKREHLKFRRLLKKKEPGEKGAKQYTNLFFEDLSEMRKMTPDEIIGNSPTPTGWKIGRPGPTTSQGFQENRSGPYRFRGTDYYPSQGRHWSYNPNPGFEMDKLAKINRLRIAGKGLATVLLADDNPSTEIDNVWLDTGTGSFTEDQIYVVQTGAKVIQRCLMMATDPGDLVLDPTCGSGTTAYVAEQWGRRWITIDTSRVALALAQARIMGARYPYYLLADSKDGQRKEGSIAQKEPSSAPTYNNIRQGFVYDRVPHITLKSIANNTEIDVIYDKYQQKLEPIRVKLNIALKEKWEEWEIPWDTSTGSVSSVKWTAEAKKLHTEWWNLRIARQKEIDASISVKAEYEFLYDKPYDDKKKVRVAGPFTLESLSPHRMLAVDEDDELIDTLREPKTDFGEKQDFAQVILENLKTAGIQQAHKEDKINFNSIAPWPGEFICAEARYMEGETERRAGIFIGPEFGTVAREDLVKAARECGDADFDVLIACAFSYEAHTTEFEKLGRIRVLKARMNADLHMASDLKNTGKGNLFVIFGEPDVDVGSEEWIVDSLQQKVAPYEIFKLISGIDSLAKINGLNSKDLQSFASISCRREVWDYLTVEACSSIDTGKYSRGTIKKYNGGVSTVSWYCAGVTGGVGNFCDSLRKAGIHQSADFRKIVDRLRRDQQNASRSNQIPFHSPLLTFHSPLSTIHYSQVTINGVDVFDPSTGEIRSDNPDNIACWFIDTDYNEESFFVRHAYFLGANDPYKSLKTTLKAEINQEVWESLHSVTSRPFNKPSSGRIAVKVINHLGDEVLKVYKV